MKSVYRGRFAMTKGNFSTIAAALTVVILVPDSAANAKVYDYTFTSSSESVVGQFIVDPSDDKVTDFTGTLSGAVDDIITGLVADASFPVAAYSPEGPSFSTISFIRARTRTLISTASSSPPRGTPAVTGTSGVTAPAPIRSTSPAPAAAIQSR